MSYLTLPEAAQYVTQQTGLQIEPAALLRVGVLNEILIVAPFSSLMRNLTAHKNDGVLGLLVIPPSHLLEIESEGQAKITGAFSLDGTIAYSPQVLRAHDQLRVLVSELDRFMPRWVTDKVNQTATHHDTATPAPVEAVGALVAKSGPVLTAPAQCNSTKTPRSDSIDPVIKLAKTTCRDPNSTAEVWAQMEVLAQNEQAPFLASTEDGLKYHRKGADAYFTRDALDKRLHPEKRGTPANRRLPP